MAIDNTDNRPHSTSHVKSRNSGASANCTPDTPRTPSPSPAAEKEATSESTKKAPAKRHRIPIACVNCRFKKIKCDGQSPCSHCEKFKTDCIYPAVTKPVNHEYVEALENRLKSVESHLNGLLSMGLGEQDWRETFCGEIMAENTTSAIGSSLPTTSVTSAISPPPASHTSTFNHRNHLSVGLIPPASYRNSCSLVGDTSLVEDGIIGAIHLTMGNLRVDRDGTAKYLPNFKECAEQSYIETHSRSSTASAKCFSTISEITNLDWESVDLPRPYTLPKNILTLKATQALINIYFNSVHTFFPILNKSDFLSLCHKGEFRVPPFLLIAICAVASRHATESERESIAKLVSIDSHHVLFDHARALIDTFIDIPRLSTVQGLLLLSYYQIKEKRPNHFFRVRVYLNMAIRMAQDMQLSRDLHRSDGIETSLTGDNMAANSRSPLSRTSTGHQIPQYLEQSSISEKKNNRYCKKITTTQQEGRLAWLGCFFLDGLINSMLGLDYSVTRVHLEMRKLIREANNATVGQGASLIFWYLHLDLVQLYRRICDMYRFSANTNPNDDMSMRTIIKGTEMLSIEHALENWIRALPIHLVYTRQKSGATSEDGLPSYYTLYLHRFYYSLQILLYRPLIGYKAYRGDLSKPDSALSKCAFAAEILTEIGESIFNNYSWPWPGCGLFAYHMLQALEIHIYLMTTRSRTETKDLYLKTVNLIHGYSILAKLERLASNILEVKQAVKVMIDSMPVSMEHTPLSILQQIHQYNHHENTSVIIKSNYPYVDAKSIGNPSTMATQYTQQQLNIDKRQPEIPPNMEGTTDDPHMFSRHSQETFLTPLTTSTIGPMAPENPYISPETGFPTDGLRAISSADHILTGSPISLYLNEIEIMSLPLSGQQQQQLQDQYQHSYDDQASFSYIPNIHEPVLINDLINLDISNEQSSLPVSIKSVTQYSGSGVPESDKIATLSPPELLPSEPRPLLPPPKPPKRILSQLTGSTNSSNRSASQKPPVPKKPSRLIDITSIDSGQTLARYQQQQQQQQQQQIHHAGYSSSIMSPPPPLSLSAPQSQSQSQFQPLSQSTSGPLQSITQPRRPIRVLQAQSQLYGMGELKSSLNQSSSTQVRESSVNRRSSYTYEEVCPGSEANVFGSELNYMRQLI
ncbi:hypothetical protein BGZ46_001898 [Entomortierella lignicola]|nr:hypothetical protein BGZ46_001898 [Entomortierella lignicola]